MGDSSESDAPVSSSPSSSRWRSRASAEGSAGHRRWEEQPLGPPPGGMHFFVVRHVAMDGNYAVLGEMECAGSDEDEPAIRRQAWGGSTPEDDPVDALALATSRAYTACLAMFPEAPQRYPSLPSSLRRPPPRTTPRTPRRAALVETRPREPGEAALAPLARTQRRITQPLSAPTLSPQGEGVVGGARRRGGQGGGGRRSSVVPEEEAGAGGGEVDEDSKDMIDLLRIQRSFSDLRLAREAAANLDRQTAVVPAGVMHQRDGLRTPEVLRPRLKTNPIYYSATILAIDNEAVNNRIMENALGRRGYKVVQAFDGEDLVRLIMEEGHCFDIVLIDLVMKRTDMSGLDAVLALRTWEVEHQCDPTPALAVTGSIMKPERDECYAYGIQGMIPKPINIHGIATTVFDFLSRWDSVERPRAVQLPPKLQPDVDPSEYQISFFQDGFMVFSPPAIPTANISSTVSQMGGRRGSLARSLSGRNVYGGEDFTLAAGGSGGRNNTTSTTSSNTSSSSCNNSNTAGNNESSGRSSRSETRSTTSTTSTANSASVLNQPVPAAASGGGGGRGRGGRPSTGSAAVPEAAPRRESRDDYSSPDSSQSESFDETDAAERRSLRSVSEGEGSTARVALPALDNDVSLVPGILLANFRESDAPDADGVQPSSPPTD